MHDEKPSSSTSLDVLVFANGDAEFASGAQRLAAAVSARFIDRMTRSLDDLRLVAQHGVVEPFCVLVLSGEDVIARIPRSISVLELRAVLDALARLDRFR